MQRMKPHLDHGVSIIGIQLVCNLWPPLCVWGDAALAFVPHEDGKATGMWIVQQSLLVDSTGAPWGCCCKLTCTNTYID